MGKVNPFTINPIREKKDFIGRKHLIHQVADMLTRRQSCHIVGERKSGKTSFLYRMAEEFSRREDTKFVFLDMQRLKPYSSKEILGIIAHSIDENLSEKEMGYKAFADFIGNKKIILAFDEVSAIAESEKIGSDFFDFLRGILTDYNVVFLTAHREELYEMTKEHPMILSPFFNYFKNFDLGYFTKEEAEELIRKGGEKFFNDCKDWIIERAYHHPFLLQLLCLTLLEHYEENNEDIRSVFYSTEEEVYRTMESHFKYWYQKSSEDEKKVLGKVVSRKGKMSKDEEKTAQDLEKRLLIYKRIDRYHLVSCLLNRTIKVENRRIDQNYLILLISLIFGLLLSYDIKDPLFLTFYIGSIIAISAMLIYRRVGWRI